MSTKTDSWCTRTPPGTLLAPLRSQVRVGGVQPDIYFNFDFMNYRSMWVTTAPEGHGALQLKFLPKCNPEAPEAPQTPLSTLYLGVAVLGWNTLKNLPALEDHLQAKFCLDISSSLNSYREHTQTHKLTLPFFSRRYNYSFNSHLNWLSLNSSIFWLY